MRGGSLPLIAFGTLNVVLGAINWVWTGDAIQVASFGFAAATLYGAAALLWLRRREAVKRGPPPALSEPEPVPEASLSAVLTGLALATILFGLVWASFLLWFGGAVLVLSLGRMWIELQAERESVRRVARGGSR